MYTLRNLAKNLLQSNKQFQSNYPDGLKRSLLKKVSSLFTSCSIFNNDMFIKFVYHEMIVYKFIERL